MSRTRYGLAVAIPASITSDTPHLREKTAKLGLIARAASIFGVEEILLYRDDANRNQREDIEFCEHILQFVETPQYLRKTIFKLEPSLRFTGILPPLQTPPHNIPSQIRDCKIGDVREGIVINRHGDVVVVDVGLERKLECKGNLQPGTRVTVQLTSVDKTPASELVAPSMIPKYWGYKIRKLDSPLGRYIQENRFDLTIGTSRYGLAISDVWSRLTESLKQARSVLIAFGSPKTGLVEVLQQESKTPEDVFNYVINTVPRQNVSTIRTDEAVLVSLGILNIARETLG